MKLYHQLYCLCRDVHLVVPMISDAGHLCTKLHVTILALGSLCLSCSQLVSLVFQLRHEPRSPFAVLSQQYAEDGSHDRGRLWLIDLMMRHGVHNFVPGEVSPPDQHKQHQGAAAAAKMKPISRQIDKTP
jgi:hypothetical protein